MKKLDTLPKMTFEKTVSNHSIPIPVIIFIIVMTLADLVIMIYNCKFSVLSIIAAVFMAIVLGFVLLGYRVSHNKMTSSDDIYCE